MIITMVGTVGSGKSLSATKMIIDRQNQTYTNYSIQAPKTIRLKKENIISEESLGFKKDGTEKKKLAVNWKFWNNAVEFYEGFDIVLDEVHNIVHSRMSMTKNNTLLTIWFSQIRKILGASECNHIFLISQRLNRIDIAFRDLIDTIVYCEKSQTSELIPTEVQTPEGIEIRHLPKTIIDQFVFRGENCVDAYWTFKGDRKYAKRMRLYQRFRFVGNPYFKYYNSFELIKFGESVYL